MKKKIQSILNYVKSTTKGKVISAAIALVVVGVICIVANGAGKSENKDVAKVEASGNIEVEFYLNDDELLQVVSGKEYKAEQLIKSITSDNEVEKIEFLAGTEKGYLDSQTIADNNMPDTTLTFNKDDKDLEVEITDNTGFVHMVSVGLDVIELNVQGADDKIVLIDNNVDVARNVTIDDDHVTSVTADISKVDYAKKGTYNITYTIVTDIVVPSSNADSEDETKDETDKTKSEESNEVKKTEDTEEEDTEKTVENKEEEKAEETKTTEDKSEDDSKTEEKTEDSDKSDDTDKTDNTDSKDAEENEEKEYVEVEIEAEVKVVDEEEAKNLVQEGEEVLTEDGHLVVEKDGTVTQEVVPPTNENSSNNNSSSNSNNNNATDNSANNSTNTNTNTNTNNGSAGNSNTGQTTETHVHSWVPITQTVTHEATGHYESQAIYGSQSYILFSDGYRCSTNSEAATYAKQKALEGISVSYSVKTETVQTGTEQVWVQDSEAWTETVTTGYSCSGCGATK